MKKIIIIYSVLYLLFAQTNVATTAASFLEIGAGARSLSMGGAYVSVANDVSALYWNPSGIVNVKRPSIHIYHSPWLVETNYYHGGAVVPLERFGVLGVSYTAVTMDEMDVRTVIYPNGTGEKFGVSNLAMGIAYAKKLTNHFSFGLQTKFVQEKIWKMQAKGLSLDIGTLFLTTNGMRIGMSISNFGGKMSMDGINTAVNYDVDETIYGNNDKINAHLDVAEWPLPLIFRFGVSRDFSLTGKQRITVAADGIHPNNNLEMVNMGLEYSFSEIIFLRVGRSHLFMESAQQAGFSYGLGLNYKIPRGPQFRMDYVLQPFGVFNNINGYSIFITF